MQTVINPAGQPIAVAGQGVDNGETQDDVSRINSEASTNISFGIAVKVGAKDHSALMLSGGSDVVDGVVKFDYNHSPGTFGDLDQAGSPPGLKPLSQFNIRRKGRIWAQLDTGVTSLAAGVDRAFARFAANGGNTIIGRFGKSTDAGNIDITKQAVFVSGVRLAADGSKIAEMDCAFVNKP